MRNWLKRLDSGFIVVLLLAGVVLWPFLGRASLPAGTDAELHIFRLFEVSRHVEAGILYPRWASAFFLGYGYPIFNYYAPLTYLLGTPVALLPGLDAVFAVKFVFVLGLLMAGIGMYGFVRDEWSRPAGLVAAAAFLYAPYVQYIDPHARGVLPETFSFGVFAMALWAFNRLRRNPSAKSFLASALLLSALILTHNLMAMIFTGLLGGWFVWQIALKTLDWQRGLWLAAVFAGGVGMAAFFWLPVFLERHAINIQTVVGAGSHYDFHNHFLSLGELLGRSLRIDWAASEPAYRFNLGVAQWMVGLVGMVLIALNRVRKRGQALFFAMAALILIALMLPVSSKVWEVMPGLPFLQFPWRLLGPTAAMLAVLAGVVADTVMRLRPPTKKWLLPPEQWAAPMMASLFLLAGLPMSQVAPWQPFGEVSYYHMYAYELEGVWRGTTSTADFVPATVVNEPGAEGTLLEAYWADETPDRVNYLALPATTTVTSDVLDPYHFRYAVDGDEPFVLRFFLFDFPGWVVRVDGEVAETELALPEGFLTVPMEKGSHAVTLSFEDTAARTWGWRLSAAALLAVMGAAFWQWRGKSTVAAHEEGVRHYDAVRRVRSMTLMITVFHVLVLSPSGALHDNSVDGEVGSAERQIFADYNHELSLIGYNPPSTPATGGETLDLTLFWRAQGQMTNNYSVFVHLLGPDGVPVTQTDKLNPGDFPTERWTTEKYVRDRYELLLPPDLAAGEYTLTAGLWMLNADRLPIFGDDGALLGDFFELEKIQVR